MRQILLKSNTDLDIVLTSLFAVPAKGLEALRLFDKVLVALENAGVVLQYAENGDVEIFKRNESGGMAMENGKPQRASYITKSPTQIDLSESVANWLKSRMEQVEWNGMAVRAVLRIADQLGGESPKESGDAK